MDGERPMYSPKGDNHTRNTLFSMGIWAFPFPYISLGNLVTGQDCPCLGCLFRPGGHREGHDDLTESHCGVAEPCSQGQALAAADEGRWGMYWGYLTVQSLLLESL